MNIFEQARRFTWLGLLAPPAALCLMLSAGCNGSEPTNSSLVRYINACPNGGTASFAAQGTTEGNQPFFAASAYTTTAISTSSFSFSLSADPGTTYPAATTNLSAGQSYSAIVVGRADITSSTDTRYPQMDVIPDSKTAPPSGDIALRIVNAAPDLTSASVLVNSQLLASSAAYPSFGSYSNTSAGNLAIQANQTSGNQVASQTFTHITAGHLYTAFVVELVVGTAPTYGIELLDDTTDTLVS